MKILIFSLCLLIFSNGSNCQNTFFYNYNDDSLTFVSNYNNIGEEFWTGVGPEGIKVYWINSVDSLLLFQSFGCTQFQFLNGVKRKIDLFVWLDNFYESDCLCVGNDAKPCRPDTGLADLRISFVFERGNVVCKFSDLLPHYSFMEKEFKTKLDTLKAIHFIRKDDTAIKIDSSFNYETVSLCRYFMLNYFDVTTYSFLNKLNEIQIVDSLINIYLKHFNTFGEHDDFIFYWNYCKKLRNNIFPLCGHTFSKEELLVLFNFIELLHKN